VEDAHGVMNGLGDLSDHGLPDGLAPRLLPRIRTREEYRASPRDEATYVPAVREICRRHGLPAEPLRKYASGSTIVFAVGDALVVKLFEPVYSAGAAVEAEALRHVHGRLGVSTPAVHASGEMEDWRYVVMDRLPGTPLADVWDSVSADERRSLCRQLGAALARLHALPTDGLALRGPAWDEFIAGQVGGCVERQRERGLADAWVEQIPGFLAPVHLPHVVPVMLHTEIMREHTLVQRGDAGWTISGIFDFEPAMLGAPEYEFGSVGVFFTSGDAALFRALLLAYGYTAADLTPELPRRILAYALLHRYSNLAWYLKTVPPRSATTLDALAEEWFGTG
jgi:hygromycin-B 7''-O-kinase